MEIEQVAVEILNERKEKEDGGSPMIELKNSDDLNKETDKEISTNYNPQKDCKELYDALRSFISNKKGIISVLCRRTREQRLEIRRVYSDIYKMDLLTRIRDKTNGKLKRLFEALLLSKTEFYCKELFEAMGTDNIDADTIFEILFMASNQTIVEIREMFQSLYYKSLIDQMKGEFSNILVSLCNATRDESDKVDHDEAELDARQIKEEGITNFNTETSTFFKVMTQRNYQQMKLIFEEYEKLRGESISETIGREFDDETGDLLMILTNSANGKAEFFARQLFLSTNGFGTNYTQLIRLIVSHCDVDMNEIKIAFEKIYNQSLEKYMENELSGNFKKAIFALIFE